MGEAGRLLVSNSPRKSPFDLELSALSGRRFLRLPIPNLRLAILPALVALTAPAELVLMTVWAVDWVVLLTLVALLRQPDEEVVALVLVVYVLLRPPSS